MQTDLQDGKVMYWKLCMKTQKMWTEKKCRAIPEVDALLLKYNLTRQHYFVQWVLAQLTGYKKHYVNRKSHFKSLFDA